MPTSTERPQLERVSTRLTPAQLAVLDRQAKVQDRPVSYLVRQAVEEFVARHDGGQAA